MNDFSIIKKSIIDNYNIQNPRDLLKSKFSSPQFLDWKDGFKELVINNVKFLSDGNSQNMCYTKLAIIGSEKTEHALVTHYFYLHKSIIGNFVTCYGLSKCKLSYGDDVIRFPRMVVASPVGPFAGLFKAVWQKVKSTYPDCIFLNYYTLRQKIEEVEREENEIYDLLFGYEGPLPRHHSGDQFFSFDKPYS